MSFKITPSHRYLSAIKTLPKNTSTDLMTLISTGNMYDTLHIPKAEPVKKATTIKGAMCIRSSPYAVADYY